MDVVLGFIGHFAAETNYTVWISLAENTNGICAVFGEDSFAEKLRAYCLDLFCPIGRKLGWKPQPGEGCLDAMLRTTVLRQLVLFDDEQTLIESKEMFDAFMTDQSSVDPDVRSPMFRGYVRGGGAAAWE